MIHFNRSHRPLLYLILFVVLGQPFFADYIVAGQKEQPTSLVRKKNVQELPVDDNFKPSSGVFYYDVFLGNLRLGKATVELQQQEDTTFLRVNAKTRKSINSLYKLKYRGEVEIDETVFQPQHATMQMQTGNKTKQVNAEFPQANRVTLVELETENNKTTRKEKEFESDSFILDPFSTVHLIRSLKWEIGTAEVFDIFTERKQYELQLLCIAETTLEVNGKDRLVWEIVPKLIPLKKKKKKKSPEFRFYLSQDESREILKITGHPKIGRIVARMRKFDAN